MKNTFSSSSFLERSGNLDFSGLAYVMHLVFSYVGLASFQYPSSVGCILLGKEEPCRGRSFFIF